MEIDSFPDNHLLQKLTRAAAQQGGFKASHQTTMFPTQLSPLHSRVHSGLFCVLQFPRAESVDVDSGTSLGSPALDAALRSIYLTLLD